MGKARRQRTKTRADPLGVSEEGVKEEQVLPVIQKLTSGSADERAWAAAGASNLLVSDEATRKYLLSKGIIGILVERLTDSEIGVIQEVAGALRNLCSAYPDVCTEMYACNVLTSLSAQVPGISSVINKIISNAPVTDERDREERKTVWDFAENIICIFWSLCETNEKILRSINRIPGLIPFLMSFLDHSLNIPTKVVVAAGQCLYTLTDDNKDIYLEFSSHPQWIKTLLDVVNQNPGEDRMLVRILACGIFRNVRDAAPTSSSWEEDEQGNTFMEMNKLLMPILTASLDYDIQKASQQVDEAAKALRERPDHQFEGINPKPREPVTPEEQLLASIESRLTTLQLSLELLADICVDDDTNEDDGWQDADESMEDDDMESEEVQEQEDDTQALIEESSKLEDMSSANVNQKQAISNPILQSFSNDVFPHLMRLATPTANSYPSQQTPQPPLAAPAISHVLANIHLRALECLNNFLLAMNEIPGKPWFAEHADQIKGHWSWLFILGGSTAGQGVAVGAEEPGQEMRGAVLEADVACLWAVARGMKGNVPSEGFYVSVLQQAYRSTVSDSMMVKTIGCLGAMAAQSNAVETNKTIGNFLVEIVEALPRKGNTRPDAAVEALNAIYDVYADAAFDYDLPNYVQGGFNKRLRAAIPQVRQMAKSVDRRKQRDLRLRADEALENLVAFVKYKDTERR